jgi:Kef-type K+ transport system membrane component KefB
MDSAVIIIIVCLLLLFAYIFDISASKTKIPSVILLLILGSSAKYLCYIFKLEVPDLNSLLPILGSIGLTLIVLEGSIDLEINNNKKKLILKSVVVSIIPMIVLAFCLAYAFAYFGGYDFRLCLANAIPFCIISSAIAIPTVRHFSSKHKEFIIYESSLSDIIGVLFFNFITLNEVINFKSVGFFTAEILLMFIVSFIATIILALLLTNIGHHVKFLPIIILIVLIYDVSKLFHLPALIFILLFGLFLGNLKKLHDIKFLKNFNTEKLEMEVLRFKEIVIEFTFLIRALFFILFGYLIEIKDVLNIDTLIWSGSIVFAIFIFRGLQLYLVKLPNSPLIFIAPRGLITILLFLALAENQKIALVNSSLVIQVILMTAVILMIGNLLFTPKAKEVLVEPVNLDESTFESEPS